MAELLVLSPTRSIGDAYAAAKGISRSNVITPRSSSKARGRRFDDFVVVGNPAFSESGWAEITPALLHAGHDVLDRLQFRLLGILPPPIELEREDVNHGF